MCELIQDITVLQQLVNLVQILHIIYMFVCVCILGLQRFVDVIDYYVDYKNTLISMECVDASHLATTIVRACSYPYLRLFFCHV